MDTTGDVLSSTSVWDGYTTDYAFRNDGWFYLAICSRPLVDEENFISTIELKDINIRKLTSPDIVFSANLSSSSNSTVNLRRKSQTEYSVLTDHSNSQKVVILGESYNQNWILSGAKDVSKFTTNGYGNGWIFRDGSNINIKYKLEDFVRIGFIVSGVSLISLLVYLLMKGKYENN